MQEKIILAKIITGSTAYGTTVATSDVDTMTLYKYPIDYYLGNYESVKSHGKGDDTEYEVGKLINMLSTGNPTALGLLFVNDEHILETSNEYRYLRSIRNGFLSKKCKNPFIGYAKEQIKKAETANKRADWEKKEVKRLNPIDFCYIVLDKEVKKALNVAKQGVILLQDYLNLLDLPQNNILITKLNHSKEGFQVFKTDFVTKGVATDDSCNLRTSETPLKAEPIATLLYNQDAYRNHCKDYKDYTTWAQTRNKQRYIDNEAANSSYDVKNIMHTVRLVNMAEELAQFGQFNVDRTHIDAPYLISIRQGEVDIDAIFADLQEKVNRLETLFNESSLPDDIAIDTNELVIKLRGGNC